ncbi:MAG: hypothetical protein R2750_05925 [Bacteroidales bacterium]
MKLPIDSKISFIATFIALLALFFSILDHYQNRKHNRKTVKPILLIEVHEYDKQYGIFISNQGYGPAIIDSFAVYYKNERITHNDVWSEIFNIHFLDPIDFGIESTSLNNRHVVKTGENKLIWGAHINELGGNIQLLNDAIDVISMKVYYHSIYEDKSIAVFQ